MNGLTHGIAAVASLVPAASLMAAVLQTGDIAMALGCAAYSLSLLSVLSMSALSHLVQPPRWRHLFRTLDQASIYLLIAGSATPYFIRYLTPHGWGWMLPAMWGIAFVGAVAKLRGDRINSTSISMYVLMGWFPVIAAKPFMSHAPLGCLSWIVAAGGLYMAGVFFLSRDDRHTYFHAIWHLFVIAASACTYAGIFGCVA